MTGEGKERSGSRSSLVLRLALLVLHIGAQHFVDPRLIARPGFLEIHQHIFVEPDADGLLARGDDDFPFTFVEGKIGIGIGGNRSLDLFIGQAFYTLPIGLAGAEFFNLVQRIANDMLAALRRGRGVPR